MLTDAGAELAQLLRDLEIPVEKFGDVSEHGEGSVDPSAHLYVGWYDLVGKILAGHEDAELSPRAFSVSFHPWAETRTWVEAPNAPEDSIVLSFSIDLPWVLDELP
jgi:hypothetical protein